MNGKSSSPALNRSAPLITLANVIYFQADKYPPDKPITWAKLGEAIAEAEQLVREGRLQPHGKSDKVD